MAHINLNNDLPGIRGLMAFRPETARPLNELAETLLRDNSNTLSRGDRELIGAYVSYLNDCFFCQNVHGALAQHYMHCEMDFIDSIKHDFSHAAIPEKMKALLAIAGAVQKGGKHVTAALVEQAKEQQASDREIHDTVLIAAAFCMFNRYVDGLGTFAPPDRQTYVDRAPQRAAEEYANLDLYK